MCVCSVDQLSPAFCHAYGILQTRILEQVAISSSRGSSQPRDQTHSSCVGRQTFLPLSQQGSPNNIRPHGYKVVSRYLTWSSLKPDEVSRTSCYWYLIIGDRRNTDFPRASRVKTKIQALWSQQSSCSLNPDCCSAPTLGFQLLSGP